MADTNAAAQPGADAGVKPNEGAPANEPAKDGQQAPAQDPPKPSDAQDEPPVRKMTAKDYIIQRKEKKIERLQEKRPEDGAPAPDDGDLDDDKVSKAVEERIAPIVERFKNDDALREQEAIDGEIKAIIAENPEFKQFEDKVRRYAGHESRKNIPVQSIFYEVAGKELMRIGAERAKKADEDAQHGRTGGGTGREAPTAKPVTEMTSAEFRAHKKAVMRGQS